MQNQSLFNISFKLNGNFFGFMSVNENMMFYEVVENFLKCAQLKTENEPVFKFNLTEIKLDSSRKLKDIGINNMSIIEVTAKNIPDNNTQNNQNFPTMGGFQQGIPMYSNMGGMNPNMGGMNSNMGGMNPNMGGIYPNMGGMNPNMGGMYPNMGGMNPNMGGMYQNMGGMYPNMGGMYPNMGGMAPATGTTAPATGTTASVTGTTAPATCTTASVTGTMTQAAGGTVNMPENNGNENNMSIIFHSNGKTIIVQGSKELKFSELSKRFINKAATQEIPTFFLNSVKIDSDEQKTLNELNLHNQSQIEVVFTSQVIGAYN